MKAGLAPGEEADRPTNRLTIMGRDRPEPLIPPGHQAQVDLYLLLLFSGLRALCTLPSRPRPPARLPAPDRPPTHTGLGDPAQRPGCPAACTLALTLLPGCHGCLPAPALLPSAQAAVPWPPCLPPFPFLCSRSIDDVEAVSWPWRCLPCPSHIGLFCAQPAQQ